jgi:hypothetical protein
MKIAFDPAFDSGSWPGPLKGRDACIDEAWVGPLGFMNILETRLGLTGHYPSGTERALKLLRHLRAQEGFWSKSASKDAIGTALRLLKWRDELWLSGWRGEARTERLRQLAALTRDAADGIADRLQAACDVLAKQPVEIEEVVLLEPETHLSAAWRAMLSGLRKQRTAVKEKPPVAAPGVTGDLAGSRTKEFEATGDGSLQMLRTFGVLEAADHAAAWLRALPPGSSRVVVGPEPLLDAALRRHGLPTLGAHSPLPTNALLAILPLLLELAWDRKDPQVAAELLLLPRGPTPRSVAWRLLTSLQHGWPAVGSDSWKEALETALLAIEGEDTRAQQAKLLSVIFDGRLPRSQYPAQEIRARIQLLDGWAHRFGPNNPELKVPLEGVSRQCKVLKDMLDASGLEALSPTELGFMLAQSTGPGDAPHPAQAGIGCVQEPGAVAGAADHVLIWNFTLSRFKRHSGFSVSEEERADLRSKGVELVLQDVLAKRDSERWTRPFLMARRAVLCACPRRSQDGQEEFPHPAWDEIRARATDQTAHRLEVQLPMAAPPLQRREREARVAVRPTAAFSVEPDSLHPRPEESASSLGKLLGCPLAYALEYSGGLRQGLTEALPSSDLLRGSLAHHLIRLVMQELKDGKIERAAAAGERVAGLFDELAPALAGGLFLPGMDDARADLRNRLRVVVEDVAKFIVRAGLEVLGTEEAVGREALGIRVGGKVDLRLGKPLCVLDFKWSGATRRRQELLDGTALQLAVYSHAVREGGEHYPSVGFVIIRGRRILYAGTAPLEGAEQVSPEGAERTWSALARGFEETWREIRGGKLPAMGNLPKDDQRETQIRDGVLMLKASCDTCAYGVLCGRTFGDK